MQYAENCTVHVRQKTLEKLQSGISVNLHFFIFHNVTWLRIFQEVSLNAAFPVRCIFP